MLYAVRIGNWVEIRESESPPRKVRQVLRVKSKKKKRYYDEDTDTYRYKTITSLEATIYIGGRVLGVISSIQFYKDTKTVILRDSCEKVPEDKEKVILERFKT